MRGSSNSAENISVAHVIQRTARGKWLWYHEADGTAAGAEGPGHRFTNIHLFHNWNSSLATGTDAPGVVIDGARIHGAPNHCGVGGLSTGTVRNVVIYNCQDYVWLNDTNGTLIEHATIPGGGMGSRRSRGRLVRSPFGTVSFRAP